MYQLRILLVAAPTAIENSGLILSDFLVPLAELPPLSGTPGGTLNQAEGYVLERLQVLAGGLLGGFVSGAFGLGVGLFGVIFVALATAVLFLAIQTLESNVLTPRIQGTAINVHGLLAAETIAAVHTQGGLCVAAHPYYRMVPSMGHRGLRKRGCGPDPERPIDAIEVFNAGLLSSRGNRRAAVTATALGLPAVGGSDSHHSKTIGYGHTIFPGRSARDLRAAIESGQTYAAGQSWGPMRTAEVIGLIVRRELRDPAKWARRSKVQTSPPYFGDCSRSNPRISYR